MATTGDRPRFRQDLVAEAIEDAGSRFIDVMDPNSGMLFRFYEVEYSLACGMDGQRDVAGLVRWAEDELGLRASQKEVKSVIATLGDIGYLEGGAVGPTVEAPARPTPPTPQPAARSQPVAQAPANRWDQATVMGIGDLGAGVIAGTRPPAASAADVELGRVARSAQRDDMPRAPELELGASGTSAARGRAAHGEDVALGAPGRGMDVDLAADMPIRPGDVKEAVRQSQVMRSVDVPQGVQAELDRPVRAARPEPQPAAPEPRGEPRRVDEQRRLPTAQGQGTSSVLIVAFVLVVLAAAAYLVWRYVLTKKRAPEVSTLAPTPQPPQAQKPEPPGPAPIETVKLVTEQLPAEELKAASAGQIAVIVATDTVVKQGEPIAKLAGFRGPEAQLAAADKQIAKIKSDLGAAEKDRAAAQAAGSRSGLAAADKKITTAQKAILEQEGKKAAPQAELDKLLVKAPSAGKVTAVAKLNAKVTPSDVIATVARNAVLVATFKSAAGVAVGSRVLIALKGSAQQLSCEVVSADAGIKAACAKDSAPEGAEAIFAGPDPNAPPPSPAPPPVEPPATDASKGEPKAETPTRQRPRPRARPRPETPGGETPAGSDKTNGGEKPAGDKPPEPSGDKPAGSAQP